MNICGSKIYNFFFLCTSLLVDQLSFAQELDESLSQMLGAAYNFLVLNLLFISLIVHTVPLFFFLSPTFPYDGAKKKVSP